MADKDPIAQAVTEKKPTEKPSAADFGRMVSSLASTLKVTGPALRDIIAQTKTRRQNADALRAWLKDRPKAK